MRKLLYGLVGLVVVAVAAALVAPSFIDWSRYRTEIGKQLENATGHKVVIEGGVALRVLPTPTLTATDVRLGPGKGFADKDLARIQSLKMRLAFWRLVRGEIVGTTVTLEEPEVVLQVRPKAAPNWIPGAGARERAAASRLRQIRIEKATVRYRDPSLPEDIVVKGLDLVVYGPTPTEPPRATGSFGLAETRIDFRFSMRQSKGRGRLFDLSMFHTKSETRLRYFGRLSVGDRGPQFLGSLDVETAKLAAFVEAVSPKSRELRKAGLMFGTFRAKGEVAVAGAEISLGSVSAQLGKIRATGGIDASLGTTPNLRITARVDRFDLDRILAEPEASRPALPLDLLQPIAKTKLSIDLRINAMVYRRDIIRDLRMLARAADREMRIESFRVQLPGAAETQLAGRVALSGRTSHFDGRVAINAANIRGVLDWLGVDTARVPADRLRRLVGESSIRFDRDSVEMTNANFNLDTAKINGGGAVRLDGRPRIDMALEIAGLDLRAYIPRELPIAAINPKQKEPAKPEAGQQDRKTSGDPKTGRTPQGKTAWYETFDANLKLTARDIGYNGRRAKSASLSATMRDGAIAIQTFRVDGLSGIDVEARGAIREVDGKPRFDFIYKGKTASLGRIAGLLGIKSGALWQRIGEAGFRGRISGTRTSVNLDTLLEVTGGKLRLTGKIVPDLLKPNYDLAFELEHPKPRLLARAAGFAIRPTAEAGKPASSSNGPLRASGKAQGTLIRMDLRDVKASLGEIPITGEISVETARIRPLITGRLEAPTLSVEHLAIVPVVVSAGRKAIGKSGPPGASIPTTPDMGALYDFDAKMTVVAGGFRVGGYTIRSPKIELAVEAGALDVRRFTGRLFGGDLTLRMAMKPGKVTRWTGGLSLTQANLATAAKALDEPTLLAGKLDLDVTATADGEDLAALTKSLSGTIKIKMGNGELSGFDLAAINKRIVAQRGSIALINLLTEGMSSGKTRFRSLSGSIVFKSGVGRTEGFMLDAEGGKAKAKGTIDLKRQVVEGKASFRFAAIPDAPPLEVAVAGWPGKMRATVKFNEIQRYLMNRRPAASGNN